MRPTTVTLRQYGLQGFTLLELVVSMAVMSILMLAMGSALLIATQALPDAARTTTTQHQTSQIAEQITAELQEARHITERSAQAISFTVADRNGDGSPERIRYAWSGLTGDPLTRQYNSGTVIAVLTDVNQFDLSYDLHTDVEQYPGFPIYGGADILLSSYTTAVDLTEYILKTSEWIGQYFRPASGIFPEDAVYWRVSRVRFEAQVHDLPYEDTYVQLRLPDAGNEPTDTVIEQQIMYEGDLTASWAWQEFAFSGAHDLVPGADLCLVLQALGQAGNIRWENGSTSGAAGRLSTQNSGNTWTYLADKCMRYEVYGQMATPGPDQTATRQYITGIQLQLQASADAQTRTDTAVHLPNMPELLSAVWELDFSTDPTALNMNGDASPDWNVRSGSFDPDDLVNGVWVVDGASTLELDTVPDHSFVELTTIDLRFRCAEISGGGAYFWINADYAGGNFMPIAVTIDERPDATQTTTVRVGPRDVVVLSGMSPDFVNVRLLIDPDLDTVHIKINNINQGTFAYTPYAPMGHPQRATLHEWGSDAEWDYVRIRVGGNNP